MAMPLAAAPYRASGLVLWPWADMCGARRQYFRCGFRTRQSASFRL